MATEIINERLMYPSYEIIEGEKIMSPAANLTHGGIVGRLYMFIGTYLDAQDKGYVLGENTDIHFPDGTLFKPDLSVVLKANEKILDWGGDVHGVPDMVVEVLSKSTKKKDVSIKKDLYEFNGVREYWIVDPWAKSVAVYLLRDGKYFLEDEYILFDEQDLNYMTEEEKAEIKHEVPIATLDGVTIPLKYIFKWGYSK